MIISLFGLLLIMALLCAALGNSAVQETIILPVLITPIMAGIGLFALSLLVKWLMWPFRGWWDKQEDRRLEQERVRLTGGDE